MEWEARFHKKSEIFEIAVTALGGAFSVDLCKLVCPNDAIEAGKKRIKKMDRP